ncbi:MAG: hypothetical protein OMM_13527, partial [Candidatus Magnetoglobus multicellularis str. Araruama]
SCPNSEDAFYGQDGNYVINQQSYTKLDDQGNELPNSTTSWAMVRDNVTGLIWEVKQAKDSTQDLSNVHDADNQYAWYDSNPETNGGFSGNFNNGNNTGEYTKILNAQAFGGFSDWRLPSQQELRTIVHAVNYNPTIQTDYFQNTQAKYYWSSTANDYNSDTAWGVYFYNGHDGNSDKVSSAYVRAVRGGKCGTENHLVINNDGTVTDINSGLMWQEEKTPDMSWELALSYCQDLSLAGYSDWRLPGKGTLESITDLALSEPAINTHVFLDNSSGFFWTSTTFAHLPDIAWNIDFDLGYNFNDLKDKPNNVRAVRGGQIQLMDHLFIQAPMQASYWKTGDDMLIQWEPQSFIDNVTISLSRQGGKNGTYEILATTDNDGEFNWTVKGESSVNCMLKIEPVSNPDKGTRQGLFVISQGKS